jgi:hypothetical protein
MKLKYYMRGLGVGILLTALLFTLCGYRKKLSDQEIINLAKGLGMETAENEEDPLDKVLGEMAKADEQDSSSEAKPDATEGQTANSDGEFGEGQTTNSNGEFGEGQTTNSNGEFAEGQTTGANSESKAEGQTANSGGEAPEGQAAGQTPEQSVKSTEGQAIGTGGELAEGQTAETDEKATTGQTSESAAESSDTAFKSTQNTTQTDHEEATITIKQGMTSDSVSKLLYKAGIVDDAKKFNNYIVKAGKSTKILIGEFTFSKNASYDDIIKKIAE